MKGSKAVGERPAHRGKRAFRTNNAFLNGGITFSPGENRGLKRLPGIRPAPNCFYGLQQHRVNDKAVVVIPMELWAIAICAVAFVPLFVLPYSVVDPHRVPALLRKGEKGFNRRAEQ